MPRPRGTSRADDLLLEAIRTDSPQLLDDAIRAGADVRRHGGTTPLHAAVLAGRTSLIRRLCDLGAPAEATTVDQPSPPMVLAAHQGKHDVVAALLDAGADPNARHATNGRTPLMAAIATAGPHLGQSPPPAESPPDHSYEGAVSRTLRGAAAAARMLLDRGADLRQADRLGLSPLHYALYFDPAGSFAWEIAARLGPTGESLIESARRNLALIEASAAGDTAAAMHLIHAGADVNATDPHGRFPLYRAADAGHADVARLLLERGASIDTRGPEKTSLMVAAYRGHRPVVELLLRAGANPRLTSGGGDAAAFAAEGRHHELAAYLRQARNAAP